MDWLHDSEQDMEKNLVPQFLYVQLEDNNSAIAVRMSWNQGGNESQVHGARLALV